MFYAVIFVVVLVAVSGAIAYIGDVMGRRMGKRRLSLFGLRPRHTAIVVTTITGMIIAALTLATLLGLNHQVRWAMLKGQIILKRNAELRKDNERLNVTQGKLTMRLASTEKELRDTKTDLDAQVAQARKQLDDTKAVLRDEQARLNEIRLKLASTQRQLMKAGELVKIQGRELIPLRADYESLRGQQIIFESGEEILRNVVRPKPAIPVMRAEVIGLLNQASRAAEQAGAKKGKNGRAVTIVPKKVPVRSASGGFHVITYDESKIIGFIAEALRNSPIPVVLRVVAVGNAVKDEQVTIEVRLFNNKLVFSADQTIAEADFDGTRERGQLMNDLAGFLLRDVRRAAANAGVIPVTNPREPEKLFGEVGADQLIEVLDKIKRTGGTVRVKAVAQRDVYAAGPLPLEFVVKS